MPKGRSKKILVKNFRNAVPRDWYCSPDILWVVKLKWASQEERM
jgi:hypothetical protein